MSSLFKPWSGGVSQPNKVVLTQISQQLSYVPSLPIFAGVFLFLTLSLAVLPVGIFSRSSNFILIGCFSVSVGKECPNTCQSSPGDKGKCAQTTVFNRVPKKTLKFHPDRCETFPDISHHCQLVLHPTASRTLIFPRGHFRLTLKASPRICSEKCLLQQGVCMESQQLI